MPLYSFQCPACKRMETGFRKIADRDHLPVCQCAPGMRGFYPMARIIEAPAVQTDLPGYQSPIDGRWVEGRRARHEDLRRNNCRPWEGMEVERKEAEKRAEAADAQFGKVIEAGVAEVYNGMSTESQRALAQI